MFFLRAFLSATDSKCSRASLLFLLAACCAWPVLAPAQATVLGNRFFRATISPRGEYQVVALATGWRFVGTVEEAPSHRERRSGRDRLGSYQEIAFTFGNRSREGVVRLYDRLPAVEFRLHMLRSGKNDGAFPAFRALPADTFELGFQPVPHGLYEFGKLGSQGPWVLFDRKLRAAVLSPADHYFVSQMQASSQGASSGIAAGVRTLPAGFTHATLLVTGDGVNRTIDAWGHALQAVSGRTAPSNTADILLRKLSYWTDHGAAYFYQFDPRLGYSGTLLAVKKKFEDLGLPLGSMQLDSWFYPKGATADWHKRKWTNGVGGEYFYRADKSLFPYGLASFSSELGLPLITHARWIDRASPYRKMYRMSGDVVIDPRFWEATATYLRDANVRVYEQDWLGRYAKAEPNLTDPEAFHDAMAKAMARHGLTMQYCMAAPADFLQGAQYNNLTTIRTSHDRFDRKDWDLFLYDSRLATALGIWPWTDVFRSREEGNLLASTLSAGPVGVGDALDEIDIPDLLRAVRGDGVIVKPDRAIEPLDRMFLQDAEGADTPMVAGATTAFGGTRITYVFAYPRKGDSSAGLSPSELGYTGPVYAYDWRAGAGRRLGAQETLTIPFSGGWGYAVVSPIGPSGMALIGDIGNFVTAGRSRIARYSDAGSMRVSIAFSGNEKRRTIAIYAPRRPFVRMTRGRDGGEQFQDGILRLTVEPDARRIAAVTLSQRKR